MNGKNTVVNGKMAKGSIFDLISRAGGNDNAK